AELHHFILQGLSIALSSFLSILPRPPPATLFPYTTLFRSIRAAGSRIADRRREVQPQHLARHAVRDLVQSGQNQIPNGVPSEMRSEEHTSELQSPYDLVCRLLLEKKKKSNISRDATHLIRI